MTTMRHSLASRQEDRALDFVRTIISFGREICKVVKNCLGPLELFEPGLGDVDGVVPPVRPPLEVVVGTLTLRRLRRRCLVRQAQTAWCGAEVGITMRASAGRRITTASLLRTATPALASASCALPDCGKHVRSGSRAAPEFDARNDTCYYIAHLGHPRKQMKGKQR